MRALLDTHVVVWWLATDPRLGVEAAELINDGSNDVYISTVSATETSTKVSIGKMGVPGDLAQQMKANALQGLPVSIEHGLEVGISRCTTVIPSIGCLSRRPGTRD